MDWMIDYMGGFRIVLSKSSGNILLHSSFYYVVVNFISQYRFKRKAPRCVNSFE